MSDIVERLRSPEAVLDGDLLFEAADEIEWLRVRVKFLEDELKCPSQARRALETKP